MSLPTSREAYFHYYELWDRAMSDPTGIRIRVESFESAFYHRVRLHKARAIHKAESREIHEPGDPRWNVSPYDRYQCQIRRDSRSSDFFILISPRTIGILDVESISNTEYNPTWMITSPTLAVEHEHQPQFTSPSGMKLLPTRSASTSEPPTEPSSSKPSTSPEPSPVTTVSRRL
jgi:hypothetical protein